MLSVFHESAVVVCVSLAADTVTIALFGVLRASAPRLALDVGALVRNPEGYLRAHYTAVFWWWVGLLLVASALAAWIGSGMARRALARLARLLPGRLARLMVGAEPTIHDARVSGWWLAFNNMPGTKVYLGCGLADGSFVSGWLLSYSTQVEDTADRDLTLAAPIKFRPANSTQAIERDGIGAVVVSARHIAVLFVSYVDETANQGPE